MAFLRNLLASVLGTLVALGILFFMFMVFITLAGSADEVRVKDHSVLELKFPYPIQEHSVLGIPIATGTIQKIVDRTSNALWPVYDRIGRIARRFWCNCANTSNY